MSHNSTNEVSRMAVADLDYEVANPHQYYCKLRSDVGSRSEAQERAS